MVYSYPLIKTNFEYIKSLKVFDGGIYSYQEHLIKPDYKIYNLLIDKFDLNKSETIFFDDKEKNVIAANKVGIKSFIFTNIEDIKNNL